MLLLISFTLFLSFPSSDLDVFGLNRHKSCWNRTQVRTQSLIIRLHPHQLLNLFQSVQHHSIESNNPKNPLTKRASSATSNMSAAGAAAVASVVSHVESVDFLNDMIAQLWDDINIVGGNLTKEIVEPMFKEMLPGPLSSLRFVKIDLGKKPIKLDRIDVIERSEGVMKLDVDVFWDGDCDIELKADYIGSFGVEKLKLGGRMSVLMAPIIPRLPLISAIQVAFMNPPDISLDFTGLAEIAEFSLIEKTIYKIIDQVLASILVLPSRLLVKLDPANPWYDTYQFPLGFLRLTVVDAKGFTVPKGWFKDVPDIYCKLRVGASEYWETKTISNSVTPAWNETNDFLLTDQQQMLSLKALDSDTLGGDDGLGAFRTVVYELLKAGGTLEAPLQCEKKTETGATVNLKGVLYKLTPDLSSFAADENNGKHVQCGLLTVLVAGVSHLPVTREEVGSYVQVDVYDKTFKTNVVIDVPGTDPLNPSFDAAFRVPLSHEMAQNPCDVKLTLMNNKDNLGSITVAMQDVAAAKDAVLTDEYKLENGAIIKTRVVLHGIEPAH